MEVEVVPLVDLAAQAQSIQHLLDEAALRVLRSGVYVGGPEVSAFEQRFAAYCGTEHAVGVANGTDALRLALEALGVGPGDEVVTVSHTFIATAEAIRHVGAVPRFVEVDPIRGLLDPAALEAALGPRTKAVIAVHLYGSPAPVDEITEIARPRGIAVVEDASQAHGAVHRGRRTGALGHVACFSFYPTKNLGGWGDGGAVTTDDTDLAARVRLLANHGSSERYVHPRVGWNSRLDEAQAAVLSVKLDYLDAWNASRRQLAARYRSELTGTPGLVLPPDDVAGDESVHHLFVVRHPRRDALRDRLAQRGVSTGLHYPYGVHRQQSFRDPLGLLRLPVTESWSDTCLSLPMYPELAPGSAEIVVRELRRACEEVR